MLGPWLVALLGKAEGLVGGSVSLEVIFKLSKLKSSLISLCFLFMVSDVSPQLFLILSLLSAAVITHHDGLFTKQ